MKPITNKQSLVRLGAYVLLAGLLLAFVAPIGGWKALEVLTPSMSPAVHPGDLVLVHRAPVSSLKPGDIVTYTSPFHSGETITHRVVKISKVNGVQTLVAKGDANKVTDPPVPTGRIVGRVMSVIPFAGRLLALLRYPLAVLLLVIIPGLYVIWTEIGNIRRALAQPRPRRPGTRHIDGLYRLASLVVVVGLAALIGGFTFAQSNSTASLVGNFLTVSSFGTTPSPTPFPTPSPTATPSPTSSPTPGGSACGNVTISNTGPGSINEVHCTNTNVTTNSSHTSVHITSHSSQSATSGSVTINGNTSAGTGTSGSVSNTSSDNLDVTIP